MKTTCSRREARFFQIGVLLVIVGLMFRSLFADGKSRKCEYLRPETC